MDEIGLLFKSMELSQQIILALRFLSKDDKTEKLVKRQGFGNSMHPNVYKKKDLDQLLFQLQYMITTLWEKK